LAALLTGIVGAAATIALGDKMLGIKTKKRATTIAIGAMGVAALRDVVQRPSRVALVRLRRLHLRAGVDRRSEALVRGLVAMAAPLATRVRRKDRVRDHRLGGRNAAARRDRRVAVPRGVV